MNLLKLLYSKATLKKKNPDVKDDIEKVIKPFCKEKFRINCYGVYDIDPKNLVFWICVESDKMKSSLAIDEKLMKQLRDLLDKCDYPLDAGP